jgi:hypothetical protein
VNNELKRMCKKAAVALLKVRVPENLPGGTEENKEKAHSG